MPCSNLPDIQGIEFYTEDWNINPEYLALLEKECGAIPEGEDYSYYSIRYNEYIDSNTKWEAVLYVSDEVFDPYNYNEKSLKSESKIVI